MDDSLGNLATVREMFVDGLNLLLEITHEASAIGTHGIDAQLEGIATSVGCNAAKQARELRLVDKGEGAPVEIDPPTPASDRWRREVDRIGLHHPLPQDDAATTQYAAALSHLNGGLGVIAHPSEHPVEILIEGCAYKGRCNRKDE